MSRRALLDHNSGEWHGLFIRLDQHGVEQTRFPTVLNVQEEADQVVASLTDSSSNQTRSMRFGDLPTAMQVSPLGHWSLGSDPFYAWNWSHEICLVFGPQRRRLIVRGNTTGLQSLVVVQEARPTVDLEEPPTPLNCSITVDGSQQDWRLLPDLRMQLNQHSCSLKWLQPNGEWMAIKRQYDGDGALLPLPA